MSEVVAGHVDSPYFDHNPGTLERIPVLDRAMRRLSPDDVAGVICDAVQHRRRRVVAPPELRSLLTLSRLAPTLVSRLAVATGTSRSSRTASTRP